jgi:integrase
VGRRSRGDGAVFYDASRGCWTGVLELEHDPETRKRRRRKVSAPTKTQCKEKLDELRREYKRSGIVPSTALTVRLAVGTWMANLPPTISSPISRQVNADHAARINAAIGDVKLSKLTPGQVEAALRKMAADGLSASTLRATRSVLVRAIRRAQRDGLVVRNAAELADTPRGSVRKSRSMTVGQVEKLLAADLSAWWRAYVTLGVQCGLRPGELLGLAWEDVDFDQGVLRVRQSLKGESVGSLGLAGLKTPTSRRTLAMPSGVRSALLAMRKEQAADRLRLGGHYQASGLVFADSAGRPSWPPTVTRKFKVLCKDAGIGEGWQPRELRHTFVSVLSHAGVAVESIADAAGHANANITRAVYRHGLADVVTQAAVTMDHVFEDVNIS